ncbi:MAG: M13 family peptidase [Acholeplasmatales bacterium]|nr:M13 family peptidase [Acholeplasmatales bacterium]
MKDVRIQDDLYEAVNGAWLETAVIPSDRPTAGGFSDLDQGVEKTLMADFAAFAKGEKTTDIIEMKYAVEMYKKFLDVKSRNENGIKPLLPLLHKILNLKTVNDLNAVSKELSLDNVKMPINFGVETDMSDATRHSFVVLGPSLILPDTSYYSDDNKAGKQLLEVWKNMAAKALAFTDLSQDEQKKILDDAIAFDALVSKRVKSQVEWAEYTKNYNPMSLEEVAKYVAPFDIKKLLTDLYGNDIPSTIVVYDPRAIKEMNLYFNEETFALYVSWAYVNILLDASPLLSEELAANSNVFRRTLVGIAQDPVLEKQAYQFVSRFFGEPIGVYYGRTYFGEEAKKDIIDLVKRIIETYKIRVNKNTFLEKATKEKAIIKLSTMVIKMGYPDFIHDLYAKMVVNESDSLFDAFNKVFKLLVTDSLNDLNKPVDRTKWAMPGHMVNACYNPSANDITFPAAILQKPFYSINQSISENLGGIGTVIGHEISHAFDNNGAQFDENGNLKNWWTEKDYAAFKALTKQMIEEFDGIEFHGGKVNGELVVSENIADNGGMGVTLEIMHSIKDANFCDFFKNWARVWCMKAKEEYILYLLSNDVHAPATLRANIQPRNFAEWYEAFNVCETDKMYIEPSKRITIW